MLSWKVRKGVKTIGSCFRSQTVTFSTFFFFFTLCLVLQHWNHLTCSIFELDNELEDYLINILIKLPSLDNLRPHTNVKFQMPSFIQELTACDVQHLNQLNLTVLNQIRLCGSCDWNSQHSTLVPHLIQTQHFNCGKYNALIIRNYYPYWLTSCFVSCLNQLSYLTI